MIPLSDIPIAIDVEGERVTGVIERLLPNDMTVRISTPFAGGRKGLHVPHFAMCPVNWFATYDGGRTPAITPRGQARAELLLRELYESHRTEHPSG